MNSGDVVIDKKKAIIWGLIAIILQMGIFSALWLNPIVSGINDQFINDPAVIPYEYFGDLDEWMKIRTIYNIFILAVLVNLFLMFYEKIPGKGWVKGIWFGLIISTVKVFPEAFNKWTLVVYPNELILLQFVNGYVGLIIFGVMLAILFRRMSVIKHTV